MRTVRILVALSFLLGGMAFAGPPRDVPRFPGATGDGRPADFTLRGLDGQPVSLSRFLGKKPVLLVFWATWCPECEAASPRINALHDAAVKSRGIRYPVLLDEHGEAARAFGVVGIPTYVLIGRNGTVVYRDHVLPADISRFL
jgi:peroxiredoxin